MQSMKACDLIPTASPLDWVAARRCDAGYGDWTELQAPDGRRPIGKTSLNCRDSWTCSETNLLVGGPGPARIRLGTESLLLPSRGDGLIAAGSPALRARAVAGRAFAALRWYFSVESESVTAGFIVSSCLQRRPPCPALRLLAAGFAVLAPAAGDAVRAADVDASFVEALQERGWDDTAIEFLSWAADQPVVSPQFRKQAAYYRAAAQAAQATRALSVEAQKSALKQAAADFAAYADANPQSPRAVDALRERTMILAQLAQLAAAAVERLPEGAPNREALVDEAQQLYEAAIDAAEGLVQACDDRLADLPRAAATAVGSAASQRRAELQGQQAEGRRFAAILQFESATLLDPDSRAAQAALNAAQKALAKLAEEYRNDPWTRHYLGRCYQAAGEYEKALGVYETVVGQPTGDAELRRCQARTHQFRTQCLVLAGKAEEAVRDAGDFLRRSRADERSRAEWLGVVYELAEAQFALAKELGLQQNDAKKLVVEARDLLNEVAGQPGEFQQMARARLAALGVRTAERKEVRTFADALAAAREAVDQMKSMGLAARLARNNNPSAAPELDEQAAAHQRAAQAYLEQALQLADRETDGADLDLVRYYLCWIYWDQQRYQEAAVLGEHLARRRPDSRYAAAAAGVALRAYEKLLAEQAAAGEPASDYLTARLSGIAELIAARWPDSSDATAAATLLVTAAMRAGDLDEAESLIGQLPAASRAAAELSLGSALWARYSRITQNREHDAPAEAAELRDRAREFLQRGFEALGEGGSVTPAAAAGVLYLAQIRLASDDVEGALAALEHPRFGPLTLVKQGASAASTPNFAQSTYRVALSAYLSALPPRRDDARAAMEALEQLARSQGGDAQRQLMTVYLQLGVQLQRQLQELSTAGREDRAEALAAAFEDLLARVSEQADPGNWETQMWLARTSLQLGEGLTGEAADGYFRKAAKAFRAILTAAANDPGFVPKPALVLGVRKQLGDCLRGLGDFQGALDEYAAILQQAPNQLALQQAAALALEEWGVAAKQPARLDEAIRGARPATGGANLIWGWLKIAKAVDGQRRRYARAGESDPAAAAKAAEFDKAYFDARYHVARARYQAALLASGADRAKQLATARKSIESMQAMYPDLGGPQWQAAFEELLNQVKAAEH